jgi:hypothetical protein
VVEVDAAGAAVGARERIPREIWVLVGAAFLIAIGYGLVAPTLPVFVRSFDVGITAASLVISVFGGWIVARFGELPAFMTGLLVVAVSTATCGGLVNPPMNAAVADVIGSRAGRQRARRFPDGRRARRDRRPGAPGHAGRARRVRHGLRRDGSRGARRVRLLAPRARDPARASASTAGEESLAECSVAECPPGGRF